MKKILFYNISEILILFEYFRNMYRVTGDLQPAPESKEQSFEKNCFA